MKKAGVILLTMMVGGCSSFIASAESDINILEKGTSGDAVMEVQEKLIDLGYLDGSADGVFGDQTKNAIEEFQKLNALEVTGDIKKEDQEKLFSENVICTEEFALRAAIVAMTNSLATDVMEEDGNTYNPERFHSFADTSGYYMSLYDKGVWTQNQTGWYVEDLTLKIEGFETYLKGAMDITYDGVNYIVDDVYRVVASLENLDSEDPNKINEEILEVSETNPFLTINPDLLEEERAESGAESENFPNEESIKEETYFDEEGRGDWIESQFSFWDGSHNKLEDLIKENLNDEDSYDHIETNYIDVNNAEKQSLVNGTLSDLGYSQQIEIGDLFIMVEFSAKNAFGGTVKNMAYGIASYSNDTISLIDIV